VWIRWVGKVRNIGEKSLVSGKGFGRCGVDGGAI
jgi:hypothetical protein